MSDEVAPRLVDETNISRNWSPSERPEGDEGPGRADLVLRLRRYSGRQDQQGGGRNHQAGRCPEEPRAAAGEPRRTPAGPAGRGSSPARAGKAPHRQTRAPEDAGDVASRAAGSRTRTCRRRRRAGGGKVGVASEEGRP